MNININEYETVLKDLCDTIDATGGVLINADDEMVGLSCDPDWLDMAEVYVSACHILMRKIKMEHESCDP